MTRVFISHSSKNNQLAVDVQGWLKTDGHDVFLDYDRQDGIEGGDLWEEWLYERLRWADAVVCLVTDEYVTSQWCFGEIVAAKTLGSRILPLAAEKGSVVHCWTVSSISLITAHNRRHANRSAGYCARLTPLAGRAGPG
jgi:TIR domain